jgi:Swt1-like HEPN/Protein of unknown function (DUF499)
MAMTNQERVGRALDLLNQGLAPYVEREMRAVHGERWLTVVESGVRDGARPHQKADATHWDTQALLAVLWDNWNSVFSKKLSATQRSQVSLLKGVRNDLAHQRPFSSDDAYRALDSVSQLLTSIAAPEAAEVDRQRQDLLRVRFEEQARWEKRKAAAAPIEGQPAAGLKPWREIVTPHPDVASGRYQQAEFAADLAQVHRGEGSDEYRRPRDFFQRTHVTQGILQLLANALRRLGGEGGDPLVELQTSFGGGKTHSMLALYHLFSGVAPGELPGLEPVLREAGVDRPPKARRAVIVGTALSAAVPRTKDDGTVVRTLWGEIAWQLLGADGYELVAEADRKGVSPGSDALREVFGRAQPCLILIDEWVAYGRQLYGVSDLPGGSFDANLTFAQALTEAVRAVPRALVVATIPESDIEIGGEGGRAALARLQNTFGRMQTSWRPASAEESFEIVRRRLFQPQDQALAPARDAVVRAFSDFYGANAQEFPPGCGEGDYARRLRDAYPIHPELFDRLYSDWSALERFQRTRGVLRLMAKVIHDLWERQEMGLLILPSSVPLDAGPVQFELTQYLDANWVPVIERDVDGPGSLPLAIDRENPNLGRYSATRRVARTVFLGSAPSAGTAHPGIDDRRVKLGCVQPGESVATFGDALRRLADRAVHLFADGTRYWYSTQQTVTRTAQDRAAQLSREAVGEEIRQRLREACRERGDFDRVHPCPASPAEVTDEPEARLVVLDPDHPHVSNDWRGAAATQAAAILESRGSGARQNRNALTFLAADQTRLAELESAVRLYLAWRSVDKDKVSLNLDEFQRQQASAKVREHDQTVDVRLPEAYAWLLVPGMSDPNGTLEWQQIRLQGSELPAVRASRKLRNAELLLVTLGATRLRHELDRIPLWRGDTVPLRQLAEDFARYLYLPRLKSPAVLAEAIAEGLALLSWEVDAFAYAEGRDEAGNRFQALRAGQHLKIDLTSAGLLVKSDVAAAQLRAEVPSSDAATAPAAGATAASPTSRQTAPPAAGAPAATPLPVPRRFHGLVRLDPTRVGRDAAQIAQEVIQHLTPLPGAKVEVLLEIQADLPHGAPDPAIRTVTENCRTLKFESFEFEEE